MASRTALLRLDHVFRVVVMHGRLVSTVLSMRISETVHAENRCTIDSPFYRVNFWERASPRHGWLLDAHVVNEVESVMDVYRWIEDNARGRRFELFVEMQEEPLGPFTSPRTSDLIRLAGTNPNAEEAVRITTLLTS